MITLLSTDLQYYVIMTVLWQNVGLLAEYWRSTGGVLEQYQRSTATVLDLLMLLYIFVINIFVLKYFFSKFFLFKILFSEFFFQIFCSKSFILDASPFTETKRTLYVSVLWKIWYAASGLIWIFVSFDV